MEKENLNGASDELVKKLYGYLKTSHLEIGAAIAQACVKEFDKKGKYGNPPVYGMCFYVGYLLGKLQSKGEPLAGGVVIDADWDDDWEDLNEDNFSG